MGAEKKSILKSEYFFVFLVIFMIMFLNIFPYYYANKVSPANLKFTGNFYYIDDYNTYLAKAAQGEEGRWLLINKFTSKESKPRFIYIFYILLGHLSRILKINLENLFFISRIILGITLLVAIYFFIRGIIENMKLRKIIFLIICFSSGFGWLVLSSFSEMIKGHDLQPIDLMRPEANPIERFTNVPHYLLAHILLILAILFFIKSLDKKSYLYSIISGFLALFLSLVLPFHTIVLYALLVIFLVFNAIRKVVRSFDFKSFLLIFFISLPSFLWMAWLSFFDSIWSQMNKQNIVSSPPFIYIILGYGLLFLLAVLGIYYIFKNKEKKLQILPLWFLVVLVLIYLPFKIQFRFLETAFYVPVSILAGYGLFLLFPTYFNERKEQIRKYNLYRKCVIWIFIITILGTVFLFNKLNSILSSLPSIIFIEKQFLSDFGWIKDNIDRKSVILSSYQTGNIIPGLTGHTVYVGHWAETINLDEKLQKVSDFYHAQISADQAYDFLKQNKISYVIYSDWEKNQGYIDPKNYGFLIQINQTAMMTVYQVK